MADPDETYERVMAVNFWGVVHGTRAFLPHLRERREGALVNVSSVFGLTGSPGTSAYCAPKAAVRGFTESLMVELADQPVTVQLVHPGGIATNIAAESSPEFGARFLRTSPDDIAVAVADAILADRSRVVYGHGGRAVQIGANFLPRAWFNTILAREIKKLGEAAEHEPW